MSLSKKQVCLFIGLFLLLGFPSALLWKKMERVSKLERSLSRRQNTDALALVEVGSKLGQVIDFLGETRLILPQKMTHVPCAKSLGIVKKTKVVTIDPIFSPYNGSITENGRGGYHIVFRYDMPKELWKVHPFHTYIGYAELDQDFNVDRVIEKIDVKSQTAEDPRILKVDSDLFLVWNDVVKSVVPSRSMRVGKWDSVSGKLLYRTNLDQRIKPVEKNWVPFERLEKGEPSLGFVYRVHPQKILDVPFPDKNQVVHLPGKGGPIKEIDDWTQNWGYVSGGTPARLIEGEYLSFFHSFFREDGKAWYVMGAYTFEAKAPYKITSITEYPIVFPGMYGSSHSNTADPQKKIIYPAGIAIEEKGKKTLLHVSCGENDSAIKILTIDYHKLKSYMKDVK
jgi:predicted GH43/DUF377 family glycosyl hydrolase